MADGLLAGTPVSSRAVSWCPAHNDFLDVAFRQPYGWLSNLIVLVVVVLLDFVLAVHDFLNGLQLVPHLAAVLVHDLLATVVPDD